jgi:hypothetical protein
MRVPPLNTRDLAFELDYLAHVEKRCSRMMRADGERRQEQRQQ